MTAKGSINFLDQNKIEIKYLLHCFYSWTQLTIEKLNIQIYL